jgi:hypothetical protein
MLLRYGVRFSSAIFLLFICCLTIEEVATPTFTRILRRLDASYNTTIQMMLSQYKDALGKKELVEVQDWYRDDLFPKS